MANENAIYIWGRTAPVVDKTSARQEVGHPWLQMFCFSITSQNRFSEQLIGDRYSLNGDFRFDSYIITGDVVLDLFAASFESACLTLLILWPCVWMESKLGTYETKQHSKHVIWNPPPRWHSLHTHRRYPLPHRNESFLKWTRKICGWIIVTEMKNAGFLRSPIDAK